jgi:hypothetical protein
MVDLFSKYAIFVIMNVSCALEEVVKLVFKNVVKYWGLPLCIVSYRDTRFTRHIWIELFKLIGTNILVSLSYHPQADG